MDGSFDSAYAFIYDSTTGVRVTEDAPSPIVYEGNGITMTYMHGAAALSEGNECEVVRRTVALAQLFFL